MSAFFMSKNTESEFEENVLEKLENEEIRPHGNGVGLLNIDKRMKIRLRTEYGLRLYNEEEYAVAELVMQKQGFRERSSRTQMLKMMIFEMMNG